MLQASGLGRVDLRYLFYLCYSEEDKKDEWRPLITFDYIRKYSSHRGFTVVELMVVIAVIGILAGMSVGGYSQWRRSTAKQEVRSDLQAVASAMDNKRNFTNAYPSGVTALSQLSFTPSAGVMLTYKSGTSTVYCIEAASIKVPSVIYHLDSTNGNKTPEVGTC